MLKAQRVKKTVHIAVVSALPSNCGPTSGSKLLCYPMAILRRETIQNMDNINDYTVRARYQATATHCGQRAVS